MHDLIPILCSYATNFAVLVTSADSGQPWWVSLVVSILSPIFYFFIKYIMDVLITKSKTKGNLNTEQFNKLQDDIDNINKKGDKHDKSDTK